MSGKDAQRLNDRCPRCGKKMTRGVEERIEELADRAEGYVPKDPIRYRHLLPLSEIIGLVFGQANPASTNVWNIYNMLVGKLVTDYSGKLVFPVDTLLQT